MSDINGELILDLASVGHKTTFVAGQAPAAVVMRSADPTIFPPYALPADFAAQFPTPLDTTEIIAMCEETTILRFIPEEGTGLKTVLWRELNELAFTSGSASISFADGTCPEEFHHDGDNTSVDLMNIGIKKTLGLSDIMHSIASIGAGYGINALLGPYPSGAGLPGANDVATMTMANIANLKEKEMQLGEILVLNGWDNLLVNGDHTVNALEFDGIVKLLSTGSCQQTSTGTFDALAYNRFLGENCVKPQVIVGHPAAIQEMMGAFLTLGWAGGLGQGPMQVITYPNGDRITPGINFDSWVNTGVGRIQVVGDTNFPRTDNLDGTYTANLYGLRMTHNGVKLVYRATQIPLAFKDLTPGCTTIAFEMWAKTALVIKHKCAHSNYRAIFSGNIKTCCPVIL
jgi:hypothetical protein